MMRRRKSGAAGRLALAACCAFAAFRVAAQALGFGDIAGKGRMDVPEQARCCVTGVVTFAATWMENSGIVAAPDDPNGFGIWFSGDVNGHFVASLEGAEELAIGQIVEIEGVSSRLGFAPGVKAEKIAVIGEMPSLPPPREYRLHDFAWGVMDNRRAAIGGVMMSAMTDSVKIEGYTRLKLATAEGDFIAHVAGSPEKWRELVDAELTITGIAMSIFNIRGEFIGLQMEVPSADGVCVRKAADDAFAAPARPLSAILPYSSSPPSPHRCHVRGTVTAVKRGEMIVLQTGSVALRVRSDAEGLAAGDEVDAVGFPRLENGKGMLVNAEVRRISAGERPAPLEVTHDDIADYPVSEDGTYRNLDARLVSIVCRMRSAVDRKMAVDVDGLHVDVELSEPLAGEIADLAEARPKLRLTGILSILQDVDLPDTRVPSMEARRLYVASPADIVLVPDESLVVFKAKRIALRAVVGAGVLAALLAFYLFVRFLRSRADYRRLDILMKERKRMAGDLHDSIEQNLVAAKMMLQTAVSLSSDTPPGVRDAVATAGEMLMSTKAQIRETIFNLRNDDLFSRNCADVLRSLASRLSRGGVVKVRTMLRALPETLPRAVFSDILLVVQEAVTNAVKHGKARNVFIVSDPCQGGFSLRVANDGVPFDSSSALGPAAGHFGLSGMEERARRNGIAFSIGVENGMTFVKLEVTT